MTTESQPIRSASVLVEDDPDAAAQIQALLRAVSETGETRGTGELVWARSVDEAMSYLESDPPFVLLDLERADGDGEKSLQRVLGIAPGSAVVVLTAPYDEHSGLEAIARGAQDYLVKGADGVLIARTLRYAIERKRAEGTARRLQEVEIREQENVRLERGLLPRPLLRSATVNCLTLYRPGGEQALLGGDFFDVVELADGTIRAMIGDVAGHGPDEAALGVRLRVAWRTLVLAGISAELTFDTLQELFVSERPSAELFATVCDLSISPARDEFRVYLAGHPAPLIVEGEEAFSFPAIAGPPLGVVDSPVWPRRELKLGKHWAILLYTDGLVENVRVRDKDGTSRRLGAEGLVEAVEQAVRQGRSIERIVQESLAALQASSPGVLPDDMAIVALSSRNSR